MTFDDLHPQSAQPTGRRNRAVLLIAGTIALASILGVTRLKPVASIESMLGHDEPSVRALNQITQHFKGMEELIVLASLPANDHDDSVTGTNKLLAFARKLAQAIKDSPQLSAMCSEVEYRPSPDFRRFIESQLVPHAILYLDDQHLAEIADRLQPDSMREQLRRSAEMIAAPGAGGALVKKLLNDPLRLREILASALPMRSGKSPALSNLEDAYFSTDNRHLMIRIRGTKPASDLDFAASLTERIQKLAAETNTQNLDIALAGAYAIATESNRSIRADMIRSIVLSIIFLQILYLLVYRAAWVLPVALAPVALGILVAFGIFAALGLQLSPLTAVIGAILAGLGIDYTIHSLSHYHSHRDHGLTPDIAIRQTLKDVAPALMAACATSVVGFVAIALSSVKALRDFGLLGAMGLTASLLAALTVLPAILSTRFISNRASVKKATALKATLAGILDVATRHHPKVRLLTAFLAIAAMACWLNPGASASLFEDDVQVMHPRPNPPLETQHRISQLFDASLDTLLVHLEAESNSELVNLAHHVRDRLETAQTDDANIAATFGLASLLPDPNRIPAIQSAIAKLDPQQILTSFDSAVAESPFNPDAFNPYRDFLRNLLNTDHCPGLEDLQNYSGLAATVLPKEKTAQPAQAITAVILASPLTERTQRDQTINQIRAKLDSLKGATLTGLPVIGHDTEHTIRIDLKTLMAFAGGIVLLWLIIFFRSFKRALLALLPALFGFAVMLTCMRLFDFKLNTVNLIALPLLVGVGVDDGIFLVSIARSITRRKPAHSNQFPEPNNQAELMRSLAAGCHAIAMTSLTTLLTFGTLTFTSTPAIQSLGIVMSLGVSAALIAAIALLAPMLIKSNKT